ncbi:hypothetical protein U1701_11595 [Sphingomonas sp. PB2P19]|uniref:hypothetical protein n=1 Tax=Sphingomonas rhamnosi TaxID=3096156 RepID=UPI002FCB15E4
MKTISHVAAGLLALSALAGCSSEPAAPPIDNALTEEPAAPVAEEAPAPVPEPAPVEPAPVATANAVMPPPAAAIAPDEQMLDDADATGMTARANRDELATEPPANETEDK